MSGADREPDQGHSRTKKPRDLNLWEGGSVWANPIVGPLIMSGRVPQTLDPSKRGMARNGGIPRAGAQLLVQRDCDRSAGVDFAVELERVVEHLDGEGFFFTGELEVGRYSP